MSQISIAPIIDCWNIFLSEPRQSNTVFSHLLTNACIDKQNNRKIEKSTVIMLWSKPVTYLVTRKLKVKHK